MVCNKKKKKKKENRFSLNGNGIMSSFLGRQFYRSTLYIVNWITMTRKSGELLLHRTQVTPNQRVMLNAQPINLNVSYKLYPYSLQRTRSPPGTRLPEMIGNTHPRNYYNLKGKDIDVIFFFFLSRGITLWIDHGKALPLQSVVAVSIFRGGEIPVYTADET